MEEPYLILGIGELLWDIVPGHAPTSAVPEPLSPLEKRLGGAPANFAVMAGRLGDHAAILSRIGRDNLGREAIARLEPLPVDTGFIQVDPMRETGCVTVRFEAGQPAYTIHEPAAWDFLELTDEWVQLAERADAICFGSLAQRSLESRQTILALAAQAPEHSIRVFDVNLREPFYTSETIQESLELATVLRANEAELPQVLALLGLPAAEGHELYTDAQRLLDEFPALNLVALTRGGRGSLLAGRKDWHEHRGFQTKVADTIGAGDAFTAAVVHYLLRGADLPTLNEAGNRWGAWMASQPGAMPPLRDEIRDEMAAAIEGR
jgi:fructokinase